MAELSRAGAAVLLGVACLTIMVGCVIVPGLGAVASGLGVPQLAGWLVTVPSLGVVLFGPLVARLLGRIGLRNGLRLGLAAYGALGAAGVLLHGALPLLLDRLLLGAATGLVMASGTGLLARFYSGAQRLRMIARQGMAIELGGVVFLFAGGLLAAADWRYPFALYLFAWVLWAAMEWLLPAEPEAEEAPPVGRVRIAASLWRVYCAALLSMVCFFAAIISLPLYLARTGLDEAQVGYLLSFVSLVAVAAAALMPRAAGRLGENTTLLWAFAAYALAHLLFALGDTLTWQILAALALGTGFGLSIPLVNHMTIEQSHASVRGHLLAYLSMAIFLGQFLSSLLESLAFAGRGVFLAAALLALFSAGFLQLWHRCLRRHMGTP